MKKEYIYLLIIIGMLIACRKENRVEGGFNAYKKEVSIAVFDKFPIKESKEFSKNSGSVIDFPIAYEYINQSSLLVFYQYSKKEYLQKKKELENLSIAKYKGNDSCNFYLPLKGNTENLCSKQKIPVPQVKDMVLNESYYMNFISPISSTYLVLDYKKGYFINKEYYKFNRYKNIEHGFSNGALIDDINNRIVYWILIW